MDNLESVRWELHDRTDAHERLVEMARQDAELAERKETERTPLLVLPVLVSVAGVLLWLVVR
jgi:hypothetical protein